MSTTAPERPAGSLPDGVWTLRGAETVEVMRAVFADRNRITARLLVAMHEAGLARADGPPLPELDRYSPDEISAALGWSATMAGRWLALADDLVTRLPDVLAAMGDGLLDDGKARALSEWTRDLCTDHAREVCSQVLPHAPGTPLAALIERVQQVAVALDPDWAARREARARRRARVVGSVNPEGTASLSGHDLPVDDAVEALARVEALADRVRAAGIDLPVAALRATVYLRLLDGFGAGLGDDDLVSALVAALRRDPDGPDDSGPPRDGPGPGPGPGPDGSAPDGPPSDGPTPGALDGDDADAGAEADGPEGHRPDDDADSGVTDGPTDDGPTDGEPTDGEPTDESDLAPSVDDPPPPNRGLRRGVTELRVRLSTLLGLDDHPALIPTWGPVLAAIARQWVRTHARAEWRLVVTDDDGRLRHVLLTRHRPPPPTPARGGAAGRGVVEIQVPAALLHALDPEAHPDWAALMHDARTRLAGLPPDGDPDQRPHARSAAGRRRARAELVRWIQTRDRHCAAPGCRRPALRCDLDHTRDWAHHGPTAAWNLGALCRRHHRLKHRGRWRLSQPRPGAFRWRTRAGLVHEQDAPRVTEPLPDTPARVRRRPLPPDRIVPDPRRGLRVETPDPRGRDGRADEHLRRRTVRRGVVTTGADRPGPGGTDDDPPPF